VRAHTGIDQHIRGRREPKFPCSQLRDVAPKHARVDEGATAKPTFGQLVQSTQRAFSHSINDRSAGTYLTGQRHFRRFREAYGLDLPGQSVDQELIASTFLTYMVEHHNVRPRTADSYLSHAVKDMLANREINHPNEVRTPYVRGVLQGLKRKHQVTEPVRDRVRIPLTYPLLLTGVAKVNAIYPTNRGARLPILAALALAYGVSLRPGEYLQLSGRNARKPEEMAQVRHAYLWWGEKPYNVADRHLFPKHAATRFTLMIDFVKNDPTGKGMPRAIARAPKSSPFCCVTAIENYCRATQLQHNEPLIQLGGEQMRWTVMRQIMRIIAAAHGLDEDRLVVHSIRYGAPNQLDACGFDDAAKMIQGGWTTAAGMRSYVQPAFSHADRVAAALHDQRAIPLQHTLFAFNAGKSGLGGQRPVASVTPNGKN